MKILYFFKEQQTLMYQWQRFHIFEELSIHNVDVCVFNPLIYSNSDEANECLVKELKNNRYDLFMTPHNHEDLYVETLWRVKEVGIPTLLICFDNLIVPFSHKKISKHFDLVWLTSIETKYLFDAWGANSIFMPYAANPYLMKPVFTDEIATVAFVGTPYGSRVNMLNTLLKSNIKVDLFSNLGKTTTSENKSFFPQVKINHAFNLLKFPIGRRVIYGAVKQKASKIEPLENRSEFITFKDPVELNQLARVYSKYALSLSSTSARNTGVLRKPVDIINLRSFEIPMSGGLQICKYKSELANYFEEDKEILFYRTNDELIEKTQFYLRQENSKKRMMIKKAARKRAEAEHSWFERFKKVFDYLGLQYDR